MSPPLDERPRVKSILSNLIKKNKKKDKKPSVKKTRNRNKKFLSQIKRRGVVFFSRIPPGFFEDQLIRYCSKFGKITGWYLPKSLEGDLRGFGLVEFKSVGIAEDVADAMHYSRIDGKLFKATYFSPSEQRRGVIKKDWIERDSFRDDDFSLIGNYGRRPENSNA